MFFRSRDFIAPASPPPPKKLRDPKALNEDLVGHRPGRGWSRRGEEEVWGGEAGGINSAQGVFRDPAPLGDRAGAGT